VPTVDELLTLETWAGQALLFIEEIEEVASATHATI
jgi:hypothetical protein